MDIEQFQNSVLGLTVEGTINSAWELYKQSQHALWMARAKNADLMSCKEFYNEYRREHPRSIWNVVSMGFSYGTSFTHWSRLFGEIECKCLAKAKEFE